MAVQVVELFGLARLLASRPEVEVELPEGATVRMLLPALAKACPSLVGPVLLPDLSSLGPAYCLCVGGRFFVDDQELLLDPSERLLLLPAASGGAES